MIGNLLRLSLCAVVDDENACHLLVIRAQQGWGSFDRRRWQVYQITYRRIVQAPKDELPFVEQEIADPRPGEIRLKIPGLAAAMSPKRSSIECTRHSFIVFAPGMRNYSAI